MPDTSQAQLSLLPWTRQGAASAITAADTITGAAQAPFANVGITLQVNGVALAETQIRLRGPGDVIGVDANQIVRVDPRPGSKDFESNLFPAIEFDRADFPWLFTPAKANARSQLRPWLCLIVVRKQTGVTLGSNPAAPLPVLEIVAPASAAAELPDLAECWAWAHTQVVAQSDAPAVKAALDGAPQLSLSRLLCPRVLLPDTDYIACVVPTFEPGRRAGLGLPPNEADTNTLAVAWTSPPSASVTLPLYYSWEFRTGPGGNFETLARTLRKGAPAGLGRREISIGHPGFPWTPAATPAIVQLEGALQTLEGALQSSLWSDGNAQPFETELAKIVNAPAAIATTTQTSDPLLAPPLYGQWHTRRATVAPGAAKWFDQINLDPRWRAAAAIGTRVVQQHQEALMASAWDQAAEIRRVNQRLRQLQLSLAVNESLYARHLTSIAKKSDLAQNQQRNEERLLRFAAPVFDRIRVSSGSGANAASITLATRVARSMLPPAATCTVMRRLGRQRGPFSRRCAAQGVARDPKLTWVAELNYALSLNTQVPTPPPEVCARISNASLPTADAVRNAIWNTGFRVAAENQPLAPLATTSPLPSAWDYPGLFRAAAFEHLSHVRRPSVMPSLAPPEEASAVDAVLAQMEPRTAFAALARAVVATQDSALAPTAAGVTAVGDEAVLMAPTFPQPMYEPLRELSQDLVLPGIETVPPNSAVGLSTNRAFMEAYMVGLNVAMARELLWRGFPTDQRGTCFRNFWGYDASQPGSGEPDEAPRIDDLADIDDLLRWRDKPLGQASVASLTDEFVLLLRSDLLRRYPNALIYLAPIVNGAPGNEGHVMPIFNGALDPDVLFLGFPLTPALASGNGTTSGYFLILQEHPTEPRFGLDPAVRLTTAHLVIGTQPPTGVDRRGYAWNSNAAAMAAITRRAPVRVAIPVAQLFAQPPVR